jgi:hypothetical protein
MFSLKLVRARPLAAAGALAGLLVATAVVRADQPQPGATPPATPPPAASSIVMQAMRAPGPIVIDGVLSESGWQTATPITDFKQRDPIEGAPPTQKTEVRVLYDDHALYVGARLWDTSPDSIIARLSRRDVSVPADRFSVYLDPYHDKRTGYYFLVNAAGTLFDGVLYNDGWEDPSWDGVWHAHAKVDDQGWVAEMRIPYSQIRFHNKPEQVWGVNFRRVIPRTSEEIFVVYQPKKESGFVSRFPQLHGIRDIKPGRQIEFMPYLTTKTEHLRHSLGDPFNDGSRQVVDGGLDFRMGFKSGLTLNATVNPDFGQVEVDPAVVNLSDVESFFEEKRPFFTEGANIFTGFGQQGSNSYWGFNWPGPTYFYSRRIGRAPQGGVPDEIDAPGGGTEAVNYSDAPVGTSILGAAKLTGKIGSSFSFGTLHAVADQEVAELALEGGRRTEFEVEPTTYYGVVRGLKEFKERRRGIGAMATLARRSFDDDGLRDHLNSESVMAGIDGWTFLDKNQVWVVSGSSTMTHVAGSEARITALQKNPRHYFQRPDADHVEVDTEAKSLTGFSSRYWLNKQKGNVILNSGLGFMTPKYDVADVGFQSRADVINGHVGGGYKWTDPSSWYKYQDWLAAVFASYDFQGNPVWGGLWGGGFTEFPNNNSFEYKFAWNPETVNNRRTRGGPLTKNKPGYEAFLYFDTDGKAKRFYFIDGYVYTQPDADSYNWSVNPGIEIKPISNVNLRIALGYDRVQENAQYVTTVGDPTADHTFDNRYVFATLDQRTLSASIRLNWSFTPNLSLQTYIQPLISSGEYYDVKELARAKSYDFTVYDDVGYDASTNQVVVDPAGAGAEFRFDNPDFNFVSLRGNAVLRWEYIPGSTLFLVWTQQRSHQESFGDFDFGPNSRRMFDVDADNIFLAKVSYYFNP